jgi:hypothetical protein
MTREEAFAEILRLPTDPTIAGKFGHHITASVPVSPERRIAEYLRRAPAYLMHRDLERDGDI